MYKLEFDSALFEYPSDLLAWYRVNVLVLNLPIQLNNNITVDSLVPIQYIGAVYIRHISCVLVL